jgi:hypothetical protein
MLIVIRRSSACARSALHRVAREPVSGGTAIPVKSARLLALAQSLLAAAAQAQTAMDNPKCEANPLFKKFAGEVLDRCERASFKDLELWH